MTIVAAEMELHRRARETMAPDEYKAWCEQRRHTQELLARLSTPPEPCNGDWLAAGLLGLLLGSVL